MTSREKVYLQDAMTGTSARFLTNTLDDFLPRPLKDFRNPASLIRPGHHLVYFPPCTPLSSLLPDGTDPAHSPGPPFTRRMWAGGSIGFYSSFNPDGSLYSCVERIVDAEVKGIGTERKVFVTLNRRVYSKAHSETVKTASEPLALINEKRTLVFIHDERKKVATNDTQRSKSAPRPTQPPDFSHTLIPSPALLFRFSALTFNAHLIHLDRRYCQETEGHRNLLVHGPLSLVLMLEFLQDHLLEKDISRNDGKREIVIFVDYRNLAPLYADEEMKVCIKRRSAGENGSWDIWIEGIDGGYGVKGQVKTKMVMESKRRTSNEGSLENGAASEQLGT